MNNFKALMALSATQTRETENVVNQALAQRQQKEELRRKQQAEREAKEQELARKIRLQHFENERREREREQRLQEEQRVKDAVLKKRQEEAKNTLLYGSKKPKVSSPNTEGSTPNWPSSSSQDRIKADVRKQRLPDETNGHGCLTREEKRERKLALEMKNIYRSPSKRSFNSKKRKHLPGGAVDLLTPSQPSNGAGVNSHKSVKERIVAMPNTLTKLNTVKRDVRTIDEILQDRAKARDIKVLDGDEARVFDDWFGSSKKKEKDVAKRMSPSQHQPTASTAPSGTNTPASQGSNTGTSTASGNVTKKTVIAAKSNSSMNKSNSGKNASSHTKLAAPSRPVPSGTITSSARPSKTSAVSNSLPVKRRVRSCSSSESNPPPKRRAEEEADIRSEIWKLFRKDRNAYVSRDVFSDDEDMEADASALEREEMKSALIGKREDDLALVEERRREEEKKRRKREVMRNRRD